MGSFQKGRKAFLYLDIKKPFEIDLQRGEVTPCVFHFFKKNVWFDEWEFLEGYNLSDFKHDTELRKLCNSIWEDWCKKHNRKYKDVFKSLEEEE